MRRYRYSGKVYKDFIEFLSFRVVEDQANACKTILYKKYVYRIYGNEYKWL